MRRAALKRSGRGHKARELTLEPPVREAVQRFVRVLAGCGCSPQAIRKEVLDACQRIPRSWSNPANLREAGDPGHVMTLWFSDPAYLDMRGNPRSLPLRGTPLSIETLAHRIDPKLDVRHVVHYLERGGALKRTGRRYLPRDRVLIFRGREYITPALRGLFGLLGTLEHNQWCDSGTARRMQLFSHNPRFPVSAAGAFEKGLRHLVNDLLIQADADMHRRERARRKGERTVRMGVGVYQFQEEPPPRRDTERRRRARHRKRERR
jgi:hypothetical protein